MGYEAHTVCTIDSGCEAVKAQLESSELIVRGSTLKLRFALSTIRSAQVLGPMLSFEAADLTVSLQLGEKEAQKWLRKMQTPPPTLAAKLGIGPQSPAAVFGQINDSALQQALDGAVSTTPSAASALVAVLRSPSELLHALDLHAGMPCRCLWAVYEKGRTAAFGDAAIREILRGRGYKDNKTSAVSERLTATRYLKP